MIHNAKAFIEAENETDAEGSQKALEKITQLSAYIARELRPILKTVSLEDYKHFLYTMYHYTAGSRDKLMHAANLSQISDTKAYFLEMAFEEKGHHLLALRDYEEFGLKLDTAAVPPPVHDFDHFWYEELGKKNVSEYIAALYIFESIAGHLTKEIPEMVKRLNLTKKQSRWLLVHAEADLDHGNMALEMCNKFITQYPKIMLESATGAAERWLAVFKYAFNSY